MACTSGSIFNEVTKRCDWPWNTACGSRQVNVNNVTPLPTFSSNSQTNEEEPSTSDSQTTEEEPYRGEGLINIRHGRVAPEPHAQSVDWVSQTNDFFNLDRLQRSQSKRHVTESIQCENGAMGLFPHPLDCSKFLHCDRGKTFIMECHAGTVFNDISKICDWPRKTDCGTRRLNVNNVTPLPTLSSNSQTNEEVKASSPNSDTSKVQPFRGEGLINIRVARNPHLTYDQSILNRPTISNLNKSQRLRSKRHVTESIQCGHGATGLFSHPLDCSKFLQCDRGKTFIMDCFAGTVFNDVSKVCDWPRKTDCGTRRFNVITAPPNNRHDVQDQHNFSHQHQHHQPHYYHSHGSQQSQNRHDHHPTHSIRGQTRNQVNTRFDASKRPEQNRIVFMESNDLAPSQTNYYTFNDISSRASIHNQPKVTIVNVPSPYPGVNLMSRRVGDEFLKYFSNPELKTHVKSSADVHKRPVILKMTPQQFLDKNLMSGRVGTEFNVYFVNPKPITEVNSRLLPKIEIQPKQKPAPIDYIILVQKGTPLANSASNQFPQINLMSPRVGNEFYHYFSHEKPKTTPKKSSTAEHNTPNQLEVENKAYEQPTINENHNEPQASPGLFHGQPELNRKISSPLDNYNRLYYKPTKKPFNQHTNERNDDTNGVLISDNLKQLLRPYFNKNASKTTNRVKSAEKTVEPRIPSNRADVETFTPTGDHKHIQNIHPERKSTTPAPPRPQSRFPHPPESPNQPTYHRSGPYDPNKIFYPGPHSQSHPMQY